MGNIDETANLLFIYKSVYERKKHKENNLWEKQENTFH